MAKLYIEIDTDNMKDMELFTEGRKGAATLDMAHEAIDKLADQEHGLMICRTDTVPMVVQEFEALKLEQAYQLSQKRVEALVNQYGVASPLIISAHHVNEDEKGN